MNCTNLINELNQNIDNLLKEEKEIIDAEQKLQKKKLQVAETKNADQVKLRILKLMDAPTSFFNDSNVLSAISALEKNYDKYSNIGLSTLPNSSPSSTNPFSHISDSITSGKNNPDAIFKNSSETTTSSHDEFPDDLADFGLFDNQENLNEENDNDDDDEEKVKTVRAKIKK